MPTLDPTVLIIDDHALFAAGLKGLYEAMREDVLVETYACCDDAVAAVQRPDAVSLVLLDYHIPNSEPEDNLARIRTVFGNASIVLVSGETDPHKIIQAVSAGANGFIPKSAQSDTLVSALEIISAGGVYLPSEVNNYYVASLTSSARRTTHPLEQLSPSVREVVELVIVGLSNQAIADQRGVSIKTVKNQITVAFRDLGVSSRAQLILECGRFNQRLAS